MLTIKEAVERFMRHQQLRNLAPSTLKQDRSVLLAVAAYLEQRGKTDAAAVEFNDLEAWQVWLHRQGLAACVRYARTHKVKHLFKWLKAAGETLADPAAELQIPALPDKFLPPPPSAEVLQRLLDGMPAITPLDLRNRALVELLWGCMLRRAEALDLNVNDLDLDEQTVTVKSGKGSKGRVVPVPLKTADALAAYLAVRDQLQSKRRKGECRSLFLARGRGRMSSTRLGRLFQRLKDENGLKDLHAHLLRHAGAVHMLRGGADIRHVQALLHHADLETTKLYLRLVPSDLKEAYDRFFPVLRV
jgi:site-specific recombinase XerD